MSSKSDAIGLKRTKPYSEKRDRELKRRYDRARRKASPAKNLYYGAMGRAKKFGLPFDLVESQIVVPETCPVLGIPLTRGIGKQTDNSPTIDRIIPALGYVKKNIIVVSMRANRIKSNAVPDDIVAVGRFYRKLFKRLGVNANASH